MAVLAGDIQKCRDDDVGPVLSIRSNETLDDALLAPSPQGILAVLGEAEIVNRIVRPMAEPCHVGIHATGGFLHFSGSEHAEGGTALRPQGVLSSFPARRTGNHHAHSHGKAQG